MGSMFFERYSALCKERNETPNSVAKAIGASSGSVTAWKNGTEPRNTTLTKIADFFGVTTDYLLGKDNEKTPALNEKDRRDIARTLEDLMETLDGVSDLMFDGSPLSDEARESILAAMKLGLEAAKLKNKERFTPHKHKKG